MLRPRLNAVTLAALTSLTAPVAATTLASGTIQHHTQDPATHPAVSSEPVAASSPAQRLFKRVNQLLLTQYGGLSSIDRKGLTSDYQVKLDAACQDSGATCTRETAYPVIEAEIDALKDEHSFFERPSDYQDFLTEARGDNRLQFGVRLASLDGEARVILDVLAGSAAAEAGLQRGDVLRTLNGQPYTYKALTQARADGTPTSLGIQRGETQLSLHISSRETTTRDLPTLRQVGSVDVIRIPTFLAGGGVADRVHELVAQAARDHASGVVVDLRGNTGGNLFECDEAASAFVTNFSRLSRSPDGNSRTVVSMGTRLENGRLSGAVKVPAFWTGPVSVVVDKSSASCSEFFAFEVQYAGRGPIVGEVTAGVGNTATQVFPLDDAALQLTVLNYLKPDGTPYPTQIKPDVPGQDDILKLVQGQDVLLDAAIRSLQTAPTAASPNARQAADTPSGATAPADRP
ncbi:S41 family peptidase [Deinococcus sp.]|uniref:S41 family peptidase n=1 Tax=Deinococcus sp. TaxID=47478 RepID=UPI003CC5E53E